MDIKTLLANCTLALAESGASSPRLDCELLLMRLLAVDRVHFFSHPEHEITEEQAAAFERLVVRRKGGEPVSYIIGEKEFWSLRFAVTPAVLIPRPETECLLEEALHLYPSPGEGLSICDIGTGSGIIAIVLAKELPLARIVATDLSAEALSVARRNATFHGVSGRVEFRQADVFADIAGDFDIICSNPPYIADDRYEMLPEGIRNFEPRGALAAGADGLDIYRKMVEEAKKHLKKGGRLFFEISEEQRNQVTALLREAGVYTDIRCRSDYGGMDRVLSARKV
jgi:release factor glutamine methyltransferase